MDLPESIDYKYCVLSILACMTLTCSYVASLYVWRSNLDRDHPSSIKRRFFSVFCMMIVAPFFSYYFIIDTKSRENYYEELGIRWSGLMAASTLPLLLTIILFLGPLTMQFCSGIWKVYIEPVYWVSSWKDLIWVRNHVVAPLSEEWVFRSCMMPLLLQCFKPFTAICFGPFLFGIAHFHHIYEQIKAGVEVRTVLIISTFQFIYTSMFGMYSAYLFVRTGHFIAPLLAHMFCNYMGFPNFFEIPQHRPTHQILIICNFILGLLLWFFLLVPMTDPTYYDNKMYWVT